MTDCKKNKPDEGCKLCNAWGYWVKVNGENVWYRYCEKGCCSQMTTEDPNRTPLERALARLEQPQPLCKLCNERESMPNSDICFECALNP